MNSQRQWIPDPNNPTHWILNPNFHGQHSSPPPVISLPVEPEEEQPQHLNYHGPGHHCSGAHLCLHPSHQMPQGPPFLNLHGPGSHCAGTIGCPH